MSGACYPDRRVLAWLSNVLFYIVIVFPGGVACASEDGVYASSFLLQQQGSDRCLVLVDQSAEEHLSAVNASDHQIELQACDEQAPGQRWLFDFLNKRIHPDGGHHELCLSQSPEKLQLVPCLPSRLAQLWYFNHRDELFNRGVRTSPAAPLSHHPRLRFQFVEAETGEHRCYLSPFTGNVECPQFTTDPQALQKLERQSWHWTGLWPWQPSQMKLTEDIQLTDRESHRCLAVVQCHMDSINQYDCFGGAKIQVAACQPVSYQIWRYDLVSKRLFNKQAGEHFCLSWQPGSELSLEHCSRAATSAQRWYFARGAGRHYLHQGRLRWFAKLEAQYDFIKALDFAPVVVFAALGHPECGYHPVDGLWQGPCMDR